MKKEIKDNWIEALRSGKYKQNKWFLKSSGGYCCLGVLVEVFYKEKAFPIKEDSKYTGHFYKLNDNSYDFLSDKVLEELGLEKEIAKSLAIMNDKKVTFNEIADFIQIQINDV